MKNPKIEFPDLTILLDKKNKIIGVNEVGEQLLILNPTDLLGKSVDVIFPQQSSTDYRNEILTDGRKEVNLRLNDEESTNAELTVAAIVGSKGTPNGRVLTIRNNSKSRKSAMQLQQGEIFKQQNAVLRALQETTLDLHSSLDLDVVLMNIVSRACKLFNTTHGFLDMVRESGKLEPIIGVGGLEESLKYKVALGVGIAGIVWETEKPLVLDDYDNWQGRVPKFSKGTIRAIMGMPLLLDDQIVGVIGVARGAENWDTFSKDDVSLLNRFADLAVVAMQNAQLFKKAQQELDMRRDTENELRNANQILQLQIEHVELLQQQLKEWAVRDPLTELYNRRHFNEALELGLSDAGSSGRQLAILMIDSDQLKGINDQYGHKAGDDILVLIANLIKKNIRSGDVACRYGGDEFIVLLSNVTSKIAFERAEFLRKEIARQCIVRRNEDVIISISVGIALFPEHGLSGVDLLQKADQALYQAKRLGKNCVVLFGEEKKQAA